MAEKELCTKNMKLSAEFDLYVLEHPEGGGTDPGERPDRPFTGARSRAVREESRTGEIPARAQPTCCLCPG